MLRSFQLSILIDPVTDLVQLFEEGATKRILEILKSEP